MTTITTYTVTHVQETHVHEVNGQQHIIFDGEFATLGEALKLYKELVEQGHTGIEITAKTETYLCLTEIVDVKTLIEQEA